jgi:hypothetical protein
MTPKTELKLARNLAIILFVVGLISYVYAASHSSPERPPLRLMFETAAGSVLFDHKTHTDVSGYGLACTDCHHALEGDASDVESCGECHEPESEDEDIPKRTDAFHQQCIYCHQDFDAGPEKCSSCHVM